MIDTDEVFICPCGQKEYWEKGRLIGKSEHRSDCARNRPKTPQEDGNEPIECLACSGEGEMDGNTCAGCDGTGVLDDIAVEDERIVGNWWENP